MLAAILKKLQSCKQIQSLIHFNHIMHTYNMHIYYALFLFMHMLFQKTVKLPPSEPLPGLEDYAPPTDY